MLRLGLIDKILVKMMALLCIGAFIILNKTAYAQQTAGFFELTTRKKGAEKIKFEMYNNLITIPVSMNHSEDTLRMIVDTGVARTTITGLPNNEVIPLNYVETVLVAGLGEGPPVEAFFSKGNTVEVERAIGDEQDVLVMKEDMVNFSLLLGEYVHGLIGQSLFKDFIVEIDYSRGWMKLHDPKRFGDRYLKRKHSESWSVLPLSFRNGKPYIEVTVVLEDGSVVPLTLLIDSGASHALSLYHSAHNHLKIPEKNFRAHLGDGFSGKIEGYLGKVKELHFANHVFTDVVTSFPDSAAVAVPILLESGDGSIGQEVLRRFKIFFNYQDSSMVFQPSRFYDSRFRYDLSGLFVVAPFPEIPLYEIGYVRDGSVASQAGLLPGDYIIGVENSPSSSHSLTGLNEMLRGEHGMQVDLKLSRNDSVFFKTLILEDILE